MRWPRILVGLVVLLLLPVVPASHVAAKRTTFKQLILPIDCQFQVVDTGLGTVVYLTPEACGQVPPPASGGSGGKSGSDSSSPASARQGNTPAPATVPSVGSGNPVPSPPITLGPTPEIIKLNTKPASYQPSGFSTTLSLGSSVYYLPRGQASGSEHTFTITDIGSQEVTILIQPSGQFVDLPLHRTIYLDYDSNGYPAIAAQVLGASTDGHVMMKIRLLDHKRTSTNKSMAINPLLQVFIVLFVAFILISLSNVSWKWWLEQQDKTRSS